MSLAFIFIELKTLISSPPLAKIMLVLLNAFAEMVSSKSMLTITLVSIRTNAALTLQMIVQLIRLARIHLDHTHASVTMDILVLVASWSWVLLAFVIVLMNALLEHTSVMLYLQLARISMARLESMSVLAKMALKQTPAIHMLARTSTNANQLTETKCLAIRCMVHAKTPKEATTVSVKMDFWQERK